MTPKSAVDLDLKTPVQVRIPGDLLSKLDTESKKYSLSRGAVIRMILVDYFENKEK